MFEFRSGKSWFRNLFLNQREPAVQRHDPPIGRRNRVADSRWSLIGNHVSKANVTGSNHVGCAIVFKYLRPVAFAIRPFLCVPLKTLRLHQHDETHELSELDDLQDEVLRGIGRNVLNLQKMEGMLKFIVSSTGAIGSTKDAAQPMTGLERSIKSRRKAIKRMPMGRLVENLSKTLQPGEAGQGETADSENSFSLEVSFSVDNEDFTNELTQALKEIVRERNDLIHKRLVPFDPKSVESCRDLIRELDEQRARIKPQFEALSAIFLSLKDHLRQLFDYADSESFADDLKRAEED